MIMLQAMDQYLQSNGIPSVCHVVLSLTSRRLDCLRIGALFLMYHYVDYVTETANIKGERPPRRVSVRYTLPSDTISCNLTRRIVTLFVLYISIVGLRDSKAFCILPRLRWQLHRFRVFSWQQHCSVSSYIHFIQNTHSVLEYDNDPSNPEAPYRSAHESAIFAHLRRNVRPGVVSRKSDYLGVSLPSETGSLGGRESALDGRRSRSSIDALRNPFKGDDHTEYDEEDNGDELEVDLASWGSFIFTVLVRL